MNESQKKKCHAIIHSHAVAAAAGNALPIPGLGVAVDVVTMTTMTMGLCAVFGGNISEEAAKTLAIAAIKNTMLKQPIRTLARELSKLIPGLGQVVAPSIAVVMLETAGWILAIDLERKFGNHITNKTPESQLIESSARLPRKRRAPNLPVKRTRSGMTPWPRRRLGSSSASRPRRHASAVRLPLR